MPNHVCWLCEANTGHRPLGEPAVVNVKEAKRWRPADNDAILISSAFRCSACNGVSVANITAPSAAKGSLQGYTNRLTDEGFDWRPNALASRSYPDVPPHIADAATEAFECQSTHHYRAAILLARSVIEATAKNKGITEGVLYNKIEELERQDFIRPHIKAVAHGIRDFGNDMAHGDFVAPVSAEESHLVIQLMGEILDEVYQSPARLAAVQQAVQARQQGTAGTP